MATEQKTVYRHTAVHNQKAISAKATVTLGRRLTRCLRIERNSRDRQSASDHLHLSVLIRAVCLHTQTDEKCIP